MKNDGSWEEVLGSKVKGMVRGVVAGASALVIGSMGAWAQEPLRIGVLTDLSGMNVDISGKGSIVAAQMAVKDFGGKVLGRPVEVLSADHQNKADIGGPIAREWVDRQNVKVIVDLPTTPVALAALEIAKAKNVAVLASGAASSDLTGKYCSKVLAHWSYDTYALAKGTARSLTLQGAKDWFFVTADYTFGYNLERDARAAIEAAGGKVRGSVKHPREVSDLSSSLLHAQGSGAKTIGFANSAGDMTTAVKQASEFGIVQGGQQIAALLAFINDIDSLGLKVAQGMVFTDGFYWDMDDETRKWSERFAAQMNGAKPSMIQAGVYSAVLNYLKAVEAAKTDGGEQVIAKMREMPISDMFARNAKLRKDGRLIHDMYLVEVKKPSESKGRWDYYKILRTIPAEEAFRPLSESECPDVAKK